MLKNKKNTTNHTGYWKYIRLVLVALVLFVLGLGIQDKKNTPLKEVQVKIEALDNNKFLIKAEQVLEMINRFQGFDLENMKFDMLNVYDLEQLLEEDKRVDVADVFIDKHNNVHINIKQKSPIVRVESSAGAYYLDEAGDYIPVVPKVAIRVPVATGNLGAYSKQEIEEEGTTLNGLLNMARYIHEDEFLTSLIEQIDVNERSELVLVPKIGRNEIEFGTVDKMEDKFYRLKIYYKEGLKKVGLDKFSVLNLKYDDQLVGELASARKNS